MSTVTPNMNLTIPVDHSPADNDVWGSLLSTALGTGVDQHDHSAGKGVKITPSGLNINADLSFASHILRDALALDMTPVAPGTVASLRAALYTSSSDNNLYFINPSGAAVQITSGSTINVAIAGAIGGDYGSVGALLSFVDASDTYIFQQQVGSAVRQYGKVAHADLDLYEYKAQPAAGVPVNRVRQKSPSALAASYDLTWLTALPASTSIMTVTSAGQIAASPSATIVAATYSFTNTLEIEVPASMANPLSNATANDSAGQFGISLNGGTGATGQATFPIQLPFGATLSFVRAYIVKNSTNASVVQLQVRVYDANSPASAITFTQTNGGNSTGQAEIAINSFPGIPTLISGKFVTAAVGMQSGAGTTDFVYGIRYGYTV